MFRAGFGRRGHPLDTDRRRRRRSPARTRRRYETDAAPSSRELRDGHHVVLPVRANPPGPARWVPLRLLPPSLTAVVIFVALPTVAAKELLEPVQQRLQRRRLRLAKVVVEGPGGSSRSSSKTCPPFGDGPASVPLEMRREDMAAKSGSDPKDRASSSSSAPTPSWALGLAPPPLTTLRELALIGANTKTFTQVLVADWWGANWALDRRKSRGSTLTSLVLAIDVSNTLTAAAGAGWSAPAPGSTTAPAPAAAAAAAPSSAPSAPTPVASARIRRVDASRVPYPRASASSSAAAGARSPAGVGAGVGAPRCPCAPTAPPAEPWAGNDDDDDDDDAPVPVPVPAAAAAAARPPSRTAPPPLPTPSAPRFFCFLFFFASASFSSSE